MTVLLDTNLLTRAAQPEHQQHNLARDAVKALKARGETLCLASQNLYEFWVVSTRPMDKNGLGVTSDRARVLLNDLKQAYEILDETPAVRPAWEALVVQHDVKGKSAHDARLVAVMQVHGVSTLLTFNKRHFARYSEISVLTPEDVVARIAGETDVLDGE